jgi:hypothetical protein
MKHIEPSREQAVIAVSILRAIEQRRYEVALDDTRQIEMIPPWEIGSSLIRSFMPYPSDPRLSERLSNKLHLRITFDHLATQWRKERNPLSSNASDNMQSDAYCKIIGMGPDALPFIFQELQRELKTGEPDDWFIALWYITQGENPVPMENRGKLKEMARAWLEWGSQQGHLDGEELGVSLPALGRLGMP